MRAPRGLPALIATTLLAPAVASAQSEPPFDPAIDVNLFEYAAGPKTFFTVSDADVALKKQLTLDVMFTVLTNPFTVYNVDVSGSDPMLDDPRTEVVTRMLAGAFIGAYGLTDGVELDVTLPVVFNMTGQGLDPSTGMGSDPLSIAGLGDLRVEAKARLWQNDNFKIAGAAGVSVPTSFGSGDSQYLGDNLPAVRGRIAGQWTSASGRLSFGANLGAIFRKPREIYATKIGQQLTWNVGAMVRLTNRLSLVGESFGRTGLVEFDHETSPVEVDGGLRIVASRSIQVVAGGGAGLVSGIGSPEARLFVSVGYAPDTRDSDGDGISNARDRCIDKAEDPDGFQDGDGCPDDDNDGDRRLDAEDRCPKEPEDFDGYDDDDGCPETDNDTDGIGDFDDKCPVDAEDKAEPFPTDGCPADKHDTDFDKLMDNIDACPSDEEDGDGFEDWDGCPEFDNDADGVLDADDQCLVCKEDADGFADADGCPDDDNDADGVADATDKCDTDPETINGVDDLDGCPDTGGAEVVHLEGDALRLDKTPTFDKRGLSRAGQIIVDQMALVMIRNREVTKWLVAVGAKKKADADKQAAWIEARLVERGVPADRIETLAAQGAAKVGAVVQERVDPEQPAAFVCPAGMEVTPRAAPATTAPQAPAGALVSMPDGEIAMWVGPSAKIKFDKDTATFAATTTAELDRLAEALLEYTGAEVTLYVHTDASAADPPVSTQAQADALKAYLVGKGVPARRVTAAGRGAEEPVDPKKPERNRRVEIEIANP
jgi:outer membrane protein OmpA-like peptidoglycan-associated protein